MRSTLIIGGSSGIGKQTANIFLKNGYGVINLSRTECDLPGVKNYLCDVTDRTRLDECLNELKTQRIDFLIYSAGFSMASPLEFVKEGDYRYLFEVNFFAFLHCVQTLIPVLRHTSGTVCVISSMASFLPIPFDSFYSASKAALNAFTEALNFELEQENIRVIAVEPGGTKTEFTRKRKIYSPSETDGYAKQLYLSTENLARMEQHGSTPEKVAKTVYDSCVNSFSGIVCSGIKNKLFYFLSKILPKKVLNCFIKTKYFTETDSETDSL